MYAVSQAFMDAMVADRRQVDAKIVIDYTDPLIDQSIQVETSEQARISWPEQTADSLTQAPYMWASLDGTWTLDQARRPMPDTQKLASRYQVGWWGQRFAGIGGVFAEPYPTLTVTHTPRPVHSLKVVGENQFSEYPVDFTIRLRDGLGALLHEEIVTGNDLLTWSKAFDAPVLDVTSQELEVRKWSHEGRQVKILEFFTSVQETYYRDDIVEIRLLEEREVSQGSLPVGNISANEVSIRLVNDDGKFDIDNNRSPLWRLLKPNRRIRVWLGVEIGGEHEWVPLGVFWSSDWDSPDDSLEAQVRARDKMEHLGQSVYRTSEAEQSVSAAALFQTILEDAGLKEDEYEIDEGLQDIIIPWAWMPVVSHREALRLLAEATMSVVYCDRAGRVRVAAGIGTADPCDITGDDYLPPLRHQVRREQVANEIVVRTLPVVQVSEPVEVSRTSNPIDIPAGGEVHLTAAYNQIPVTGAEIALIDPPAGVSVVSADYYAWGADIVIENTGASTVSVMFSISGKPLVVQGGDEITAYDADSIVADGLLRYEFADNHLIQTAEQAQSIAEGLLASAQVARRDVEFEWRGNPALELGDRVNVTTHIKEDRQSLYAIIKQELNWAGAFWARLVGRRLE